MGQRLRRDGGQQSFGLLGVADKTNDGGYELICTLQHTHNTDEIVVFVAHGRLVAL